MAVQETQEIVKENALQELVDFNITDEHKEPLNANHRCDRCGAQAYVRVVIMTADRGAVDLLFCNHHFNSHKEKLAATAVYTHDETEKLLNK